MNKFSFLIAVSAVMLTSCSQDDEPKAAQEFSDVISFEAYTGRSPVSRAEKITSANHNQFFVFATQHTGNLASDTQCDGFMSNVKVYQKDGNWTYDDLRYWENDENIKVSFFAIGPNTPNAANSNLTYTKMSHTAESPKHTVGYEFNFTVDDDVTKQTDLIWAKAVNQTPKNTDSNGHVNLAFKHALAAIGFKAKTASQYNSVTVTIEKIEVTGTFYKEGTITLPINSDESHLWSAAEASLENRTFTITGNETPLTATAQSVHSDNSFLMIIPQTFHNGNLPKIKVYYTVSQQWGEAQHNVIEQNFPLPSESEDQNLTLAKGKAYTVTLNVSLNVIEFTSSISSWSETELN
ncbi:MAG: fimbrillin family protein [Duncaniella sp.]|nr:fimbrillin family protein [Muribaculum sp.]MCM1256061.1 fimbrillin family protein [Duncaniella sp.]